MGIWKKLNFLEQFLNMIYNYFQFYRHNSLYFFVKSQINHQLTLFFLFYTLFYIQTIHFHSKNVNIIS